MFISNKLFKVEVPIIHPKSYEYNSFWSEQKTRITAGMWNMGKWMPGRLYFYTNFYHILMNKGKLRQKVFSLPFLRDIDWAYFLLVEEARGFSGFDGDDYYTCHKLAIPFSGLSMNEIELLYPDLLEEANILKDPNNPIGYPECFNIATNSFKIYVEPREYLTRIHSRNMGVPMYTNEAQNMLLMSCRSAGKSYWLACVVLHEWLTDGRQPIHAYNTIDEIEALKKLRTSVIMGAGDLKKGTDTMKKVAQAYARIPGEYKANDRVYPAPFTKQYTGSFETEIKASYKEKEGGLWKKDAGSQSTIRTLSFNDNPFIGQGDRNNIIVIEEVGHMKNVIDAYNAMVHNMKFNGVYKFGSMLLSGCVCKGTKVWTKEGKSVNIEDLKQEDGIIGFDGSFALKQDINWFKPPAKKPCYKITTVGNHFLECSDDHPLLVKNGNTAIFKLAKDINTGDQLLSIDKVDIFGDKHESHARLIGLMIGDGSYGKKSSGGNTLSADSKEIQEFIQNNYYYSIKKIFEMKSQPGDYIEFTVNGINPILIGAGIKGQVKFNKRLPSNISEYNKESLAELIGGYYDADGNVYYNKKKDCTRIVLTSVVKPLLLEVQAQLTKFGINASIIKEMRNQEPCIGYEGQQNHIFRLYIAKQEDVIRFRENITFLSKHKQDVLNRAERGKRCVGRKSNLNFIYNEELKKGEYFINNKISGIRYEAVRSLEFIGEQDVYNLNTGPTHTYITNSFISHNTGGGDLGAGRSLTADAQFMFYHPEAFELLTFNDEWENKGKIAYFIPGHKGLNHLRDSEGILNEEKAKKELDAFLENLRKTKDKQSYEKEVIYNPRVPSEVFLSPDGNIFPIVELRERLSELEKTNQLDMLEKRVELFYSQDGINGVNYKLLDKGMSTLINQYPWPESNSKEGTPVIYEFPIEEDKIGHDGISVSKVPDGLYVIGHDPFRTNSENGSLASIVVMKTAKYAHKYGHNEVVAAYYGRPFEGRERVNEILLQMAMFYNAKVMFENNVGNVKDFFEKKKRLDLLYRRPNTVLTNKDSLSQNVANLDYGYPLSNQKFKMEALQYIRTWLLEERGRENIKKQVITYDKHGRKHVIDVQESVIINEEEDQKTIRNLDKLYDRRLLQELISYNLDGNFDGVHGLAGCVLAMEEDHNKKSQQMLSKELSDEFKFIVNNTKLFRNTTTRYNYQH